MQPNLPNNRPPHPGTAIKLDILEEYNLTQEELAQCLDVSRWTFNEMIKGRRSITPEMTKRLSKLDGSEPEMWLNWQNMCDLWELEQAEQLRPFKVTPLEEFTILLWESRRHGDGACDYSKEE